MKISQFVYCKTVIELDLFNYLCAFVSNLGPVCICIPDCNQEQRQDRQYLIPSQDMHLFSPLKLCKYSSDIFVIHILWLHNIHNILCFACHASSTALIGLLFLKYSTHNCTLEVILVELRCSCMWMLGFVSNLIWTKCAMIVDNHSMLKQHIDHCLNTNMHVNLITAWPYRQW